MVGDHLKLQAEMEYQQWEVVEKATVSLKSYFMKGNWSLEFPSSENSKNPLHQRENTTLVL